MSTVLELMTPDNHRFDEFVERLEGPEGCDFQEDAGGKITWMCGGGHDQSKSRAILEKMGNVDVEATLAYFTEHGGHCDCEVLWNVVP